MILPSFSQIYVYILWFFRLRKEGCERWFAPSGSRMNLHYLLPLPPTPSTHTQKHRCCSRKKSFFQLENLYVWLQPDFLSCSWDEMAAYDLPAMIDHVVRTTGVKQVHYLGHSQGTAMGFAGFSSNHTLAAMVKRFYALAPVTKVRNITSPVRLLAPFANELAVSLLLLCLTCF